MKPALSSTKQENDITKQRIMKDLCHGNISKSNPTAYKKDYTLQPKGIYPRYAAQIQH